MSSAIPKLCLTLLAAPGVGINSECLVEKEETGYVPIWVPFDGL